MTNAVLKRTKLYKQAKTFSNKTFQSRQQGNSLKTHDEGKLDEIRARGETFPREILAGLAQHRGVSTSSAEIKKNYCISIHVERGLVHKPHGADRVRGMNFLNRYLHAVRDICSTSYSYPILIDFWNSLHFWKVRRLCPFVLLARATCRWRRRWCVTGIIVTGEKPKY